MRTSPICVSIILASVATASAGEPVRPKQCAIDACEQVVRIMSAASPDENALRVLVRSAGREAIIASPFPVFRSNDGRMHACMRYDPFGQLIVTCLMLPSSE